ncbi:hypothetical protein [Nocardia colli]|uniref:hypothetical protein n=1 Tax=Nocardia colli TaxID=2545717 RepID=UPI0035D97B8F
MAVLAASTVFTVTATAATNAAPLTESGERNASTTQQVLYLLTRDASGAESVVATTPAAVSFYADTPPGPPGPSGGLAPWDNLNGGRSIGPGQNPHPGWRADDPSNPAINPEDADLVHQRRREMVDVATRDGAIDGAAIGAASGAAIGAAAGAATGVGIGTAATLIGTGAGIGLGALTGLVVGPIVGAIAGGVAGCIAALIFCPIGWIIGATIVGIIGAVLGPPIGAVAGGLIGAGVGVGVGTVATATGAAIGAVGGAIIGGVAGGIIGGETAHSEASRLLAQQNYDDLEAFAYRNSPNRRSQVAAPVTAVTHDAVREVADAAPIVNDAPGGVSGIAEVIDNVAPAVVNTAMDVIDSAPAPVVDAVFDVAATAAPQLQDLAGQFGLTLNR